MDGGFNTSSGFDDFGFGNSFFAFDGVAAEDDGPVLGDLTEEIARSAGGSWLALVNNDAPPSQLGSIQDIPEYV